MKKFLLALAVSAIFLTTAQAQSSVTLYGVIDAGIDYVNNVQVRDDNAPNGRIGKPKYALLSARGSRFGLRGAEDLGGGLKAVFTLENGFSVETGALGQGGIVFGRQSFVGLSGEFGTITLGRQYDSIVDFVAGLAICNQCLYAGHPGDIDNFGNSRRINRSIKYTSANISGLTFGGLYSFGGRAGKFSQNRIWSLGADYKYGPLILGAAYLNAKHPNLSFYGNDPNQGTGNNIGHAVSYGVQDNPVLSGYASANTLQIIAAGTAYTFGPATLGLAYSHTKLKGLGDPNSGELEATNPRGYSGTAFFNDAEFSLKYRLTPALIIGSAYNYTQGSKIPGTPVAKYHQYSIGIDYLLTKRTDVYFGGTYQHASGKDSTGQAAVAAISGLTPSKNNRQGVLRIGLRRKF